MKLEDAVRALRDEAAAPADTSDETRSRVVAGLDRTRRNRSRRPFLVLPIAAVLAAASASAAVTGHLPSTLRSISQALHLSPRLPSPAPPNPEPPAPAPAPTVISPDPSTVVAPDPIPPPPSAPIASPPSTAPPKPTATTTTTATTTATATATPDTLPLYRTAHRLHFVAQDPPAALAAWTAYLTADPSGPFALEARYNRAICLVRLGRTAEAREALAPFAMGTFGAYRRHEAKALLDALDRPESLDAPEKRE